MEAGGILVYLSLIKENMVLVVMFVQFCYVACPVLFQKNIVLRLNV